MVDSAKMETFCDSCGSNSTIGGSKSPRAMVRADTRAASICRAVTVPGITSS